MEINKKTTSRGFALLEFEDLSGEKCNIQKSSLVIDDAIWFGVADANPKILASSTPQGGTGWVKLDIHEDVLLNTRMHLSRKQVKALLPILQEFVKTGEI